MWVADRLTPLRARLRSRLGLEARIWDGAVRSWEISPAVDPASLPAAIFEEADLQRITGIAPNGTTIENEIRIVRARRGRHGPTIAHELRDAVLSHGHVFSRKGWARLGASPVPVVARGPMEEFDSAALGSTDFGARYFGHWIVDDLPLLMAVRELAPPLSTLRSPTPTQQALQRLLVPDARTVTDAFCRRLVVLDDIGQNAYKKRRYLDIRSRVAALADPVVDTPGVMLIRGTTGNKRILENEQEVAASMRARGWDILEPEKADLLEIARRCAGARIVLGVEGSQLANGMMCMPDGATLLTIQPPQRFCMVLKHYCDCVESAYAFIVGIAAGEERFRVEIAALHRLVDRIERRRTLH